MADMIPTTGCKHTSEFNDFLVNAYSSFTAQYPNHEQQFLAIFAGVLGNIMASHIANGVLESVVQQLVAANMKAGMDEQFAMIRLLMEEMQQDAPNHPGTETKQ